MSCATTPQEPQALAAMFARLSASLSPGTSIGAFCENAAEQPGGQHTHTILSTVQHALLPFFTTAAVLPLRATCKEACAAVAEQPWDDMDTYVPPGSLAAWRACFPHVRSATISAYDIMDEDFEHLKGLHELNIEHGNFSGAGLVHLRGIHTLWMCGNPNFEGRYLGHLRGIHTLDISSCDGVTDADLRHLRGIHTLRMWKCVDITGAGFKHLRGIHTLLMSECESVTDAALRHLRGIKELNISETNLTGSHFRHLHGIHTLCMSDCHKVQDSALEGLRGGIQELFARCCTGLTDAALRHLTGIKYLDMSYCSGIKGAGFVRLRGIKELEIWECPTALYQAAEEAGLPLSKVYVGGEDEEEVEEAQVEAGEEQEE